MKRLAISAEGATEREFVNRILAPHLRQHGWTAVVGVDLGGNVSLDKIRGVLPGLLSSFDLVSTLYDYYGFRRRGDLAVEVLETRIGTLPDPVQRHRLLPYVQLHEFEALLFAVPEQTCAWLEGASQAAAAMQAAVREKGSPELVNDRVETSPSHRLKTLFPRFDKKLHGPDIIELAGLSAVRAGCPRLDGWITRLERLGMSGG
jgi:hypothetical protein